MPLVGVFAAFLVALLILLICLAAWVMAEIFARAFQHVPVVGGWIASNIRTATTAALAAMLSAYDPATADVGNMLAAIIGWGWRHMFVTSQTMGHVANLAAGAVGTANQAISDATTNLKTAEAYAVNYGGRIFNELSPAINTVAHNAAAALASDFASAEDYADAQASTVLGQAQHLYNLATAGYEAAVSSLTDRVASLETAVQGDISSVVNQIQSDLTIAIATAEQDAAAALSQANAAAVSIAATAGSGTLVAAGQVAHDLVIGPWQTLLPDIEAIGEALDPAVAIGLGIAGVVGGALPITIPGILSLVIPAVGAIAAEVESCVVGNCDGIGQIANIFRTLEEATLWAALVAVLAEAVHDPQAMRDDIEGAIYGIVQPVYEATASLIGL